MVKWSWVRSSISTRRGGHHVRTTQSRSAVVPLGRRGLRAADGQALPRSDVRGHSRHRTPYELQSAPRHPRADPGHPSSYHRVFSRRRWSLWPWPTAWPISSCATGSPRAPSCWPATTPGDEHRGGHVYGKGRHRDPLRSTHSYTAYRWGHKWVVLAILVRFPFANRPWALPVLVALYRSREWNQQHRRRHRTPAQLLRRLVAVLLHWFPHRHFTLTGDGGYGSHEMARFVHRHRRRLTLVSRFVPDAQLSTPPPVIAGKRPAHRPRTKGEKLPTPKATVAATEPAERTACNVSWYGGGRRDIEVVTATGNWYHSGEGLVPLRLGLRPRSDQDASR